MTYTHFLPVPLAEQASAMIRMTASPTGIPRNPYFFAKFPIKPSSEMFCKVNLISVSNLSPALDDIIKV